jgi:putative ABC transport system ATP-binding protein
MPETLLEIREAILRRGSVSEGFAVRVGEFAVRSSELLAILGPSGCGKSTLLDTLGLVLRPDSAEVFEIDLGGGRLFTGLHRQDESRLLRIRRQHMGYILQSGGLIPSMTIRENILTACHFSGKRFDRARFSVLIERLGLGPLLSRRPRDLSGGQRQRAAIARALVHGPSLVLADEPTAAVDHILADEVCHTLRECAKEFGAAVVMVTHNRELADTFADRILVLGGPSNRAVTRI